MLKTELTVSEENIAWIKEYIPESWTRSDGKSFIKSINILDPEFWKDNESVRNVKFI